jgi:hypothetical protein
MSRRRRFHSAGHSYRELIATVQESASDLVDYQMKRDRDRFAYEKQKLCLLLLIALSLWVMFFLLMEKLDDSATGVPAGQLRSIVPNPAPTSPDSGEPVPSQFHYVI